MLPDLLRDPMNPPFFDRRTEQLWGGWKRWEQEGRVGTGGSSQGGLRIV